MIDGCIYILDLYAAERGCLPAVPCTPYESLVVKVHNMSMVMG
jgi:hypothetical protein